jgi:RNA polymerase-binding transcription factor DksA
VTSFERNIRTRLLSMRSGLVRRDPAAAGTAEGTEHEVEEIEATLARLAQGTFGVCEECGRALGRQRLLAEPTARLCMPCLRRNPGPG